MSQKVIDLMDRWHAAADRMRLEERIEALLPKFN
jgi:hypothetical protein